MKTVRLADFHGGGSKEDTAMLPDVFSPAHALNEIFTFQSYFDSTLLEKALLTQSPAEPIINSTLKSSQVPGYAVGLHPSSQTPVAIQFNTGAQQGSSAVMTLKPGQVLRPHGLPGGMKSGAFSGFSYGLPFGWLGGGAATLVVFTTPDASVDWSSAAEVIFHRARYAIKQPSDLTLAGSFNNAPKNWPMRFPWTQALQGTNSIPQKGKAVISIVEPTKVVMRLFGVTTLANPCGMRAIFQSTNDLGLDSANAAILTTPPYQDFTWDSFVSFGTSGNLSTQTQVQLITNSPIVRLAADDGGVVFVDITGTTGLTGLFVDVVRYGKL